MDRKVKYWVDLSDYDMETAKALLHSKRYLYVGFIAIKPLRKYLRRTLQRSKMILHLFLTVCLILQKKWIL